MFLTAILPHSALVPYIERYVLMECSADEVFVSKLIPRCYPALFFMSDAKGLFDLRLGSDSRLLERENVYVGGVGNEPGSLLMVGPVQCIVVIIKIEGFPLFFKEKVSLFTNKIVSITDASGSWQHLNEQLWHRNTRSGDWARLIDQFILKFIDERALLPVPDVILHALDLIQLHRGFISVNRIADNTFTCNRNLSRLFQEHIGIAPKRYVSMVRFSKVMDYYIKTPEKKLGPVLQRFPFYDHSHLSKEFFKFMGNSPTSLSNHDLSINTVLTRPPTILK